MRTYEVKYISRYYDEKIHSSEIIKAKSKEIALRKFAKKNGIKDFNEFLDENFFWNDGNWLSKFKSICEIEEHTCPHCNGLGKITIKV